MLRLLALLAGTVVLLAGPVAAANIRIVSMHYSAAYPVPHISYEGETAQGDVEALDAVYSKFVNCRDTCIGPEGGATAVVTLDGPGGNYGVGLALADYLRAHHIAAVVERGMQCYSACAFAFLGGSGWSPQEGVGTYVDRMVEPGSVVGFHAPYFDDAQFKQAIDDRGTEAAQGATRDNLSLMVQELVKWNVDPEVLSYMVGMPPDQTYNLLGADDLYLARTALPPTSTLGWITDIPTAVRNACEKLMAIDERDDPQNTRDRFTSEWTADIGKSKFEGPISGYRISDEPLEIGLCGVTDASMNSGTGDLDVALYYTPGIDGFNEPGVSLFNRQHGWSTAGTGHNPLKRIFQRGALNYFFLPTGVNMDSLDVPAKAEIDRNRFNIALPPPLATLPESLTVDSQTITSRVSHDGDIWVFERVGPKLLYDTALADTGLGRTYTNNASNDGSFIREGSFADTGASFSWFGFVDGDSANVTQIIVLHDDGSAATADDLDKLRELQCGISWMSWKLGCS